MGKFTWWKRLDFAVSYMVWIMDVGLGKSIKLSKPEFLQLYNIHDTMDITGSF